MRMTVVADAWRCHLAVFHQFISATIYIFLVDYLPLHLSLPQVRVYGFLHQIHNEEPAEKICEKSIY